MLTTSSHLSLFWAWGIQLRSYFLKQSICTLSTYQCPGLQSGLCPAGFFTTTLRSPALSPFVPNAPPISLYLIARIIHVIVNNMKLHTMQFYHVTSSLLCPNIFLGVLLANTLRLCFFFNVRNQVYEHEMQNEKFSQSTCTSRLFLILFTLLKRKIGSYVLSSPFQRLNVLTDFHKIWYGY